MSLEVKDILMEMGYSVKDFGKNYRTKPLYRESNNNTSLCIDKNSGRFVDFSAGVSGNLEDLVKLTLGLKDLVEAQKWLTGKINLEDLKRKSKPKIKTKKIFSENLLKEISPVYHHWEKRGISAKTLSEFRSGLVVSGQMAGRYVFPIFNSKKQILGFAGRDIYENTERPKWKLIGDKSFWIYPLFLNYPEIKNKKELIIVESIGDCLSLWEAGIRNTMVLFGVKLQDERLKSILKMDLKKIIISLNNDFEKEEVNTGLEASCFIKAKLQNFFDEGQVIIKQPDKKDFGEMSKEEILNWKLK